MGIKYSNFKRDKNLKKEIISYYNSLIEKSERELEKLYTDIKSVKIELKRSTIIKIMLSDDNFFDAFRKIASESISHQEFLQDERVVRAMHSPEEESFVDVERLFEVKLNGIYLSQHGYITVDYPIKSLTNVVTWNKNRVEPAMKIRKQIKELNEERDYLTYQ